MFLGTAHRGPPRISQAWRNIRLQPKELVVVHIPIDIKAIKAMSLELSLDVLANLRSGPNKCMLKTDHGAAGKHASRRCKRCGQETPSGEMQHR